MRHWIQLKGPPNPRSLRSLVLPPGPVPWPCPLALSPGPVPWPCPLALPPGPAGPRQGGHGRGATAGEPAEGSPVRDASQPHAGPVLSTRYARDAAQTVRQAHHGGLSKESVRGRQVTGGSTAMARKRHP
jgi:hypothetical protein